MGSEAFRDGSAAFERAAVLAEENERLKAENAELRSAKSPSALREVLRERDELRAHLEKRGLAHVTATNRIREEAKAQRKTLEARIFELEVEVRNACQPRNELVACLDNARLEAAVLRAELKETSTEVDELGRARAVAEQQSEQLVAKLERAVVERDDNQAAVRRRLIEERDELFREVKRLARELEKAKTANRRSLWARLFPSARRP